MFINFRSNFSTNFSHFFINYLLVWFQTYECFTFDIGKGHWAKVSCLFWWTDPWLIVRLEYLLGISKIFGVTPRELSVFLRQNVRSEKNEPFSMISIWWSNFWFISTEKNIFKCSEKYSKKIFFVIF